MVAWYSAKESTKITPPKTHFCKFEIMVKNPKDYKLPARGVNVHYIIAREDYYFVYPTNYHKYLNYYKDSFQHGGVSMEEIILPVLKLDPK